MDPNQRFQYGPPAGAIAGQPAASGAHPQQQLYGSPPQQPAMPGYPPGQSAPPQQAGSHHSPAQQAPYGAPAPSGPPGWQPPPEGHQSPPQPTYQYGAPPGGAQPGYQAPHQYGPGQASQPPYGVPPQQSPSPHTPQTPAAQSHAAYGAPQAAPYAQPQQQAPHQYGQQSAPPPASTLQQPHAPYQYRQPAAPPHAQAPPQPYMYNPTQHQGPSFQQGNPAVGQQGGAIAPPPSHSAPIPYQVPPRNHQAPMARLSKLGGVVQGKLSGYLDHLSAHSGPSSSYMRPGTQYHYGPIAVAPYAPPGAQPAPSQYGQFPAVPGPQPGMSPYGPPGNTVPTGQPTTLPYRSAGNAAAAAQPAVSPYVGPASPYGAPVSPIPPTPPAGADGPPAYTSQPSTPAQASAVTFPTGPSSSTLPAEKHAVPVHELPHSSPQATNSVPAHAVEATATSLNKTETTTGADTAPEIAKDQQAQPATGATTAPSSSSTPANQSAFPLRPVSPFESSTTAQAAQAQPAPTTSTPPTNPSQPAPSETTNPPTTQPAGTFYHYGPPESSSAAPPYQGTTQAAAAPAPAAPSPASTYGSSGSMPPYHAPSHSTAPTHAAPATTPAYGSGASTAPYQTNVNPGTSATVPPYGHLPPTTPAPAQQPQKPTSTFGSLSNLASRLESMVSRDHPPPAGASAYGSAYGPGANMAPYQAPPQQAMAAPAVPTSMYGPGATMAPYQGTGQPAAAASVAPSTASPASSYGPGGTVSPYSGAVHQAAVAGPAGVPSPAHAPTCGPGTTLPVYQGAAHHVATPPAAHSQAPAYGPGASVLPYQGTPQQAASYGHQSPTPAAAQRAPSQTSASGSTFGSFKSLVSQLESIALTGHSSSSPATGTGPAVTDFRSDYDIYPMFTTPMQHSGAPELVNRYCYRNLDTDFESTWYIVPVTPNFMTCSWCHANHIARTPFASVFHPLQKKGVRCMFHVPRVTKILWPAVVQSGDVTALTDFMKRRSALPRCKGLEGAVQSDGVRWFSPVGRDIPNFIVCETCYEDIVLGTSFGNRIGLHATQQGPDDTWACAFSRPYLIRALLHANATADWTIFTSNATKRLALQPCSRAMCAASTHNWYTLRGNPERRYCETCFLDELDHTPFAAAFELHDPYAAQSTHLESILAECTLNTVSTRELIAVGTLAKHPLPTFTHAMAAVAASPPCGVIAGGTWYTLTAAPAADFDVCAACHAGVVQPHGLASFFRPVPMSDDPTSTRVCDLSPAGRQFGRYMARLCQALATGRFALFEDRVRKWTAIPACPVSEAVVGKVWYGWEECPVCLECYEGFVAGTALAEEMPWQKRRVEEEVVCGMYSPRMRGLYAVACRSGDVAGLLAVSRERMGVWRETVPRLKALLASAADEAAVADADAAVGANFAMIDSLNSVTGMHELVWDGGAYVSSDRVEAERHWKEAQQGYDRAGDSNLWDEAAALEGRWKVVE